MVCLVLGIGGAKNVSIFNHGSVDTGAKAVITDGSRYPLFLFSDSSANSEMIDVSDVEKYPDKTTFYENFSSLQVKVKKPHVITVAPGERKISPFPDVDPRNEYNAAPVHASYTESGDDRTFVESVIQYVDGYAGRNFHWIAFGDRPNTGQTPSAEVLTIWKNCRLGISGRIIPYSVGDLDYPGLPINTGEEIDDITSHTGKLA